MPCEVTESHIITVSLESNRQIKINFDGGDLSSDAGLLLIKEFVSKLGIDKLFSHSFKTNDSASFRYHTDKENLLQMIYMIIAGYFEDDASDELTNDPVFKPVLNKDALASQPTVSRFFNRMDEDTLNQFLTIGRILRKRVYSVQMPQAVILDLDSTLLDAYGKQKGRAFNFHYQSNGYHPLVILFCLLLSSDKVFTILIKGFFGLLFKIRHLNFTTNGCSFFIHLIGETAIFN